MSIWNSKRTKAKGEGATNNPLGTGYDIKKVVGLNKIRESIKDSLTLDTTNVDVENVNKAALEAGKIRGYNAVLSEQSKQQLKVGQGGVKTYQILLNHAVGAARTELQYQDTSARSVEQLSEVALKLGVTQESHRGYSTYNSLAEEVLTNF